MTNTPACTHIYTCTHNHTHTHTLNTHCTRSRKSREQAAGTGRAGRSVVIVVVFIVATVVKQLAPVAIVTRWTYTLTSEWVAGRAILTATHVSCSRMTRRLCTSSVYKQTLNIPS